MVGTFLKIEEAQVRIPNSEHTSRRWRIHDLAPEFHVEDVWQLPGAYGPEDFQALVRQFAGLDPARS